MPTKTWQLMDGTTWTWFKVMATEFSRRLPSHFYVTRRAQGEATVSDELAFDVCVSFDANGAPLYAFSSGAVIAFYDICQALTCDERFWSHVPFDGEWFHDFRPHPRHDYVDYSYVLGQPFEKDGVALFIPRVTVRNSRSLIGDALYNMIVSIVAQHEQAHVLHGHLHLLGESGCAGYSESGASPAGAAAFDFHAAEFDADLLPSRMYGRAFEVGMFERMAQDVGLGLTPDIPAYLRLASCAYFILFCLLYKADGGADRAGPTHPSPSARILNHFLTLDEALREAGLPPFAGMHDLHAQLAGDFGLIASTLAMPASVPRSFDLAEDSAGMRECRAVRARLETLARQLEAPRRRAIELTGGFSTGIPVRRVATD
jgi:hypothetical protein